MMQLALSRERLALANTESSDSDFLLACLTSTDSFDPSFVAGGNVRTYFGDLNGGANGAAFQSGANGEIRKEVRE